MTLDVVLSDNHPVVLELSSLREAAAHFQTEAHRATVQLRHQSLEHATLLQHLHTLENENCYLRTELQVHRTAGPIGTHRETLQIQELTLALRRLSDKLDLTEKVLLERNKELSASQRACGAAKRVERNAIDAVKHLRSELAAGHARERDLEQRVKTSEEQRKMTDIVVEEYASLVRSLEGRPSSSTRTNGSSIGEPSRSSLDGLTHARQSLHKLLQDSNNDSEKLHAEIDRLNDELETTRSDLEVERVISQERNQSLAQVQLELHQLKRDDNAAAKMVSRYMKFSQSSTDLLHDTIDKLKTRQETIMTSYEARLQHLEDRLASEKRQSEMLRRALDELAEDISREAYGRRREIVLRLQSLAKEELFSERLRRWLVKSGEAVQKARPPESEKDPRETFQGILADAQDLLFFIDGVHVSGGDSPSSSARVYASYSAAKVLQAELQRETDRRLHFQHQLVNSRSPLERANSLASGGPGVAPDNSYITEVGVSSSTSPGSPSQVNASKNGHAGEEEAPVGGATSGEPNESKDSGPAEMSSNTEAATLNTSNAEPTRLDAPCLTLSGDAPSSDDTSEEPAVHQSAHGLQMTEAVSDIGVGDVRPPARAQTEPTSSRQSEQLKASVVGDDGTRPVIRSSTDDEKLELASMANDLEDVASHPGPPANPTSKRTSSQDPELKVPEEDSMNNADSDEKLLSSSTGTPLESTFLSMMQDDRLKHPISVDQPENSGDTAMECSAEKNKVVVSLLSRLADVDERYTSIQRSFRDCHFTLEELKQASCDTLQAKALDAVIERLDDYCEDARVELEIRISDEERIAKGFQTLLSVPGALNDEVNEQEVVQQVEAFLDGSDPAVLQAQETLNRKLDDLEHDIASIKRAVHSTPSPMLSPHDPPERPSVPSTPSWTSWTGSILGHSRTPSPALSFGAVMTSPRLRKSSSTRSLGGESSGVQSTLASLHLRIPMPNIFQHQGERPSPPSVQRARPYVTTHGIGLGVRGGFGQGFRKSSLAFSDNYNVHANSGSTRDDGEVDSDIE